MYVILAIIVLALLFRPVRWFDGPFFFHHHSHGPIGGHPPFGGPHGPMGHGPGPGMW